MRCCCCCWRGGCSTNGHQIIIVATPLLVLPLEWRVISTFSNIKSRSVIPKMRNDLRRVACCNDAAAAEAAPLVVRTAATLLSVLTHSKLVRVHSAKVVYFCVESELDCDQCHQSRPPAERKFDSAWDAIWLRCSPMSP